MTWYNYNEFATIRVRNWKHYKQAVNSTEHIEIRAKEKRVMYLAVYFV